MRQPSPDWIAAAVKATAHGHRDDATWLGSQRERSDDLGFGWIYFALARASNAERVLVQGTGRGFSAACLALAIEHRPDAMVTILDPGFSEWIVDGERTDQAAGLWTDQEQVRRHFAPLGLTNIALLRAQSDQGYARLKARDEPFDIILIDGDHGYEQCLKDVRNAVSLLRPGGLIVLHDAVCPDWPGVALAIDMMQAEDDTLQRVVLPIYPGVCILQKSDAGANDRVPLDAPAFALSELVEQRLSRGRSLTQLRSELAEKDDTIARLQDELRTSLYQRWTRPVRRMMARIGRMGRFHRRVS